MFRSNLSSLFSYSPSQYTNVLSNIVTKTTVTEYFKYDAKVKCFDGTGVVKVFIEKVSLHSSLKGCDGGKAAQIWQAILRVVHSIFICGYLQMTGKMPTR